jgi:DNA polymerase
VPFPQSIRPFAVQGKTRQEKLGRLQAIVANCERCPHLAKTRQQTVFGAGDLNAELMFVGEAPSVEEDLRGFPFVGPAGNLLDKLIHAMGYRRKEVYVANTLCCRPDAPAGNRRPVRAEMENCLPYLYAQIEIVAPRVILALGSTALDGLLDNGGAVAEMRGKTYKFRDTTIDVVPTYHPSYVLRSRDDKTVREWWADAAEALRLLGYEADDEDVPANLFRP